MKEIKALNIYKLNIYQVLTFMFKIKRGTASAAFRNDFREIPHRYSAGFSQSNFAEGNTLSKDKIWCFVSRSRVLEQTFK